MHRNKLSGKIPEEICELSRLKFLNLSDNNIRGLIPEKIGHLAKLQSFLLNGNSITGPVPSSLASLNRLKDFQIFRSYPAEFSMVSKAFNPVYFDRVFRFGPSVGLNSVIWDYSQLYGREREQVDDESVTIFSGQL